MLEAIEKFLNKIKNNKLLKTEPIVTAFTPCIDLGYRAFYQQGYQIFKLFMTEEIENKNCYEITLQNECGEDRLTLRVYKNSEVFCSINDEWIKLNIDSIGTLNGRYLILDDEIWAKYQLVDNCLAKKL